MFNEKEKEIINWGLQNGKSKEEVERAITNFRIGYTPKENSPQEQTYLQDTVSDIKQIVPEVAESTNKRIDKVQEAINASASGKQGLLRTAGQAIGQGAGWASDILGSVFKGVVKAVLPQKAETAVKGGIQKVATPIMESEIAKNVIQKYNSLDEKTKRDIDAVVGVGSLGLDIAGIGIGKKTGEVAIKTGIKAGTKAVELGEDLFRGSRMATSKIISKMATPKPTPIKAVGKVLQGGTKDVKTGVKAFSALDTTGVKTFSELNNKITQEISNLALKVDKDLAEDTTKKILKNLTVSATTKGGKVVKYNPVKRALIQLEELYTKIGDKLGATNIRETLNISKKEGLTNLEINDIARVYGQEFGTKAFGKLGEPLTSVNAQLYENTRKSLKNLARSGIKGKEAQMADETMTSLYRTQKLIKSNVEAVNKLQQKIQERGLLEKAGYAVSKYGDILTGGTLRGLVGGLLPRGVGYKVMNALDIERQLESNLKIIREAINAKNDAEIVKILKQLK